MSDSRAASGALIPAVNFCFQCGKRLGAGNPKCYYCGTPRRQPRSAESERRCPFCDLEIRAKAVKCPHCGEFLDGRSRGDRDGGPQQVTFIIDKAIFGGGQPMRLAAGASVPPDVLAALPPEAAQAIAQGDPSLLSDSSGVRALIAGPADLGSVGGDDENIIEATVVSVQPSGKEPACPQCKVVVEAGDGFCFHCGTGLTSQTRKHLRSKKWQDGTHLYLALTLAFAVGFGYVRFYAVAAPSMVPIACLGGTLASGLAGLIWGRGQFARALMLALAMGAGYLLYRQF